MHPDKQHILWGRDDHPSPELLQQYHDGTLPEALHHQLERHLLDCDLCTDALEGIAVSDAAQTDADIEEINQQIDQKSRGKKRHLVPLYLTDWRVAAAVVTLMLSAVLVLYYNYRQVSEQQGIAASNDQAIQEAMDLGEKETAPTAPATVAEAVPDTLRPSQMAANTMPPVAKPRLRAKAPASIAAPSGETELADVEIDFSEMTESVPEKSITMQLEKSSENASSQQSQRNAFIPESTAVARALQGRASGVQVQKSRLATGNQVQGKVVDQDGNPLPGVAVVVKGTSHGAATDELGNFALTLPDDKATLAFRFIGYETMEQVVAANTNPITVELQADNKALSEVVVTGIGKSTSPLAPVIAPKPVEGQSAYRQYLQENIRYTSDMQKGRVVVRATVMPDGRLENLQIVRSLCSSCDQEAIRLIAQGPKWQAASQNEQKLAQEVKIVVRFNPRKDQ